MADEPEKPLLITQDLLDERVDFEKGMSLSPPVTIALGAVLAILFLAQLATGALENAASLIRWGALERGAVWQGQPWRLLSAPFMHASFDHVVGNVIALYVLGMACEHAFGSVPFVVLYAASALAGALLSSVALPVGVPSVGASGAVFGLMGGVACAVLLNTKRLYVRDKRIGVVVVIWAGYSIALGFLSPFVDNFAHLGGLVGGCAVSACLRLRIGAFPRKPSRRAWVAFGVSCLIVAAAFTAWVASSLRPR
ncbi:MAG: rhomboid family intramembrane serine protease [Planctomycetes bacterium]|nr:rhomboid family intramembrane serine protease [Planctomycetota bacterium]